METTLRFFFLLSGSFPTQAWADLRFSQGVSKFGPAFAYGLARCGFGEDLVHIYEQRASRDVRPLLSEWRDRASQELQTNSRGFLSRRSTLVIPYDFPDFKVMENYINPVTSERQGRAGGGTIRDSKVMSIPRLAAFCEAHFGDWGYEDEIVKRFRTILWESAVIFLLRHAALEADERQKRRRNMLGANIPAPAVTSDEVGTPLSFIRRHLESFELSTNDRIAAAFVNRGPRPDPQANQTVEDKNPLRMQIVGSRQHVSTDHTLEYRVEFIPSIFVEMTRKACKLKEPSRPNIHTPEVEDEWNVLYDGTATTKKKGPQKPPPPPDSAVRMWVPSVMMETVHPSLVEAFIAVEAARRSGKGKGKSRGPAQSDGLDDASEEEEDVTDLDDTPKFSHGHAGPDFQPRSTPSTFAPIAGSNHVVPPHTFMDPRPSQVDPRASALHANLHSSDTVIGQSDPARAPSCFLFWFPNPDDPDMLVLEDGLELPPVARPSLKPTASPRPSRKVAMQSVERQPRNIWDNIYDQVMPVGLGSSQTRPKQTRTPKKTSSSPSQHARQLGQRVPEPAPDFAALFAEPEDELPVRRNAFDDVFDQVFVPHSQRPKKTTKTARTNPSSQARTQAQRTAPVPPRHRTLEPAPALDHSAGEVPAWSSGRQNAFDTDFNQDHVPRLERPAKTAPAPRSNPSSQARPRPQGPTEPALNHAAQFAPPEDVDPEPPRDVYDNVFEQVFWPRSHKAKPRPAKRPTIGSSTNGDALNRPTKRPRTTDAGPVAGSPTVTRPTSSQPAHSAPAARFDSDVIEIESDDDDTAPKPMQRPSGHPDTRPGHGREFIDDDVIDLT